MKKTLTISIATYNVESYLQKLLDRLLTSKRLDLLDILVIDDGGTDRSLEIAKSFSEKFPSVVRAFHKENGGWGSTVTAGIKLAHGKYFRLLDGDDLYDVDALDKFVDFLNDCETDAVLSPYLKFFENSEVIEKPRNPLFEIEAPKRINVEEIPVSPFTLETYSLTFRTDLLQDANVEITERCFYTDNEYVAKSVNLCETFSVVPYRVYQYRLGRAGQSVSAEGMKKHYKEFEFILKKMLSYTRDCIKNEKLKEIFYKRYGALSYYYFETLLKMGAERQYVDSCKQFDIWLKEEFNFIYSQIRYVPIMILRKTGYRFYTLARLFR